MHPTETNDLGVFYRTRHDYIYTSASTIALAAAGLVVPAFVKDGRWSGLTRWTIAAALFLFASVWGLNASFWVHGLH